MSGGLIVCLVWVGMDVRETLKKRSGGTGLAGGMAVVGLVCNAVVI